jgi:hypothetical protein
MHTHGSLSRLFFLLVLFALLSWSHMCPFLSSPPSLFFLVWLAFDHMDTVLLRAVCVSLQSLATSPTHCYDGTYVLNWSFKMCGRMVRLMDLKVDMFHNSWWQSFTRKRDKLKGAHKPNEQLKMVCIQQATSLKNWHLGSLGSPMLFQLEIVDI